MATIGLKINDPNAGVSDSGLAQTLSDAYFGNPVKLAELTLARAHLLSQQSYQSKLASDQAIAQQEVALKQYIFDAQRAAQDPMAEAAAASVLKPQPIIVDRSHLEPGSGVDPALAQGTPPDVQQPSAADMDLYTKSQAAARAAARIYAMTGNPEEGIN